MKTPFLAAMLVISMQAAGQMLDYATLCGATEGAGDNNDFCTFWERGDYQEMRHALGIAIRTARAAENRNRYYFDHKRGAERGAFIQLKRDWMGDDWEVLRHTSSDNADTIRVFNRDRDIMYLIEIRPLDDELSEFLLTSSWRFEELQYRVRVRWDDHFVRPLNAQGRSDRVRRAVECKVDEFGWRIGEVQGRPDCEGI